MGNNNTLFIILLFPQLMVIGLHGDSTVNVPRVVEEVHSIVRESAITQHPPAEANIVLDHLNNQTRAIPKGVLVNTIFLSIIHVKFVLGWLIRKALKVI